MQKQKKSKRINCLGHGRVRLRAESPRQRLSLLKHANYIGGASAVALGLLALALVSPGVTDSANAEDSATATTTLNITSEPLMSIGLDAAVNMDFVATSSGELKAANTKLKVTSNNPDGYKIMLSTTDGTVDITNSETGGTIKGLTTATNTTDFPDNSWGYSLAKLGEDTNVYNQVPSTSTQVKYVSGNGTVPTGADDYNLSFAAKVNSGLPAGTYSKQITVSVVANPIELNSLQHLTYMQDMTSEICTKTRGSNGETTITPGNEPSKQLTDTRDGKQYWVSKLADQNCWMTQNLDLDITDDMVNNNQINPTNTDIAAIWNASSTYPPRTTRHGMVNFSNAAADAQVGTYSWDFGRYVLKNPEDATNCGDIPQGSYVSDNCDRLERYNESDADGAHYLLGHYYQWNAATAGTGGTIASSGSYGSMIPSRAEGSICPKNWQLPAADGGPEVVKSATRFTQSYFDKYGTKTFSNLFNAYGYAFPDGTAPRYCGLSEQNGHYIIGAPFYFVRSGDAHPGEQAVADIGQHGLYWTNSVETNTSGALGLHIATSTFCPSPAYNRWSAFPIRCVAR